MYVTHILRIAELRKKTCFGAEVSICQTVFDLYQFLFNIFNITTLLGTSQANTNLTKSKNTN